MKKIIQKNRFATIIFIFLLLFSFNSAYSQPKNDQTKERINFIQNRLDDAQTAAAIWWYGWMTFYAGAAGAQFAIYKKVDNGDAMNEYFIEKKHELLVGSVKSSLAVIGLLIDP